MSQITRCPSCATMFKVVADQLRISDGWVRCGHCKQVFDASSNLQAAAPAPMMPEMALDKLRPPTQMVRRTEPPARSWGVDAAPALARDRKEGTSASSHGLAMPAPMPGLAQEAGTVPRPEAPAPEASPLSVLQVPEAAVPAFLTVEPVAPSATTVPEPLVLVPNPHLGWGPSAGTRAGSFGAQDVGTLVPRSSDKLADAGMIEWPSIDAGPAVESGYELPSPVEVLEDTAIPELPKAADVPSPVSMPSAGASAGDPVPGNAESESRAAALGQEPSSTGTPSGEAELTAGVQAAPILTSVSKSADASVRGGLDSETGPDLLADAEPSFVRSARRQAFWRKPAVRTALSMVLLALLATLGLQMALQERNHLAARLPQTRGHLEWMCRHLQCSLSPYRLIAAVEVDSSSFQKVRGDEYQFSLALKNRSDLAVEMPAVELTLTDAQDQPVLRRVLLPTEWPAPRELPAKGEWSVSRGLHIAPGGARITGYRVLAFYP